MFTEFIGLTKFSYLISRQLHSLHQVLFQLFVNFCLFHLEILDEKIFNAIIGIEIKEIQRLVAAKSIVCSVSKFFNHISGKINGYKLDM